MISSIVIYQHKITDIQATLESLLCVDIIKKVILVDNGHCDWASKLNDPRISYLKASYNGGFGYGHNLAIQKYGHLSDYFLICNPDISFDAQELIKLYDAANQSQAGLFSPKIVYPDGKNQFGQRLLPTPLNLFARRFLPTFISDKLDDRYLLKAFKIIEPTAVPNVSGSFMLFKSHCLRDLGGFDERYFMYMEDVDLSRRCAERFGAFYIPSSCVIHQHQQASYKDKALLKAHIISAVKYFNKWGWIKDRGRISLNRKTLSVLP